MGYSRGSKKWRRKETEPKKRKKKLTTEELETLEEEKDEINTQRAAKWAVKILKAFPKNKRTLI